ncbi:MAG: DMT family transporter [Pseudomonadales bacterium]
MQAWIALTVFAAVMQAVRTAGQKTLAQSISPLATTLARYVFGLPFALLYFIVLSESPATDALEAISRWHFVSYASAAALAQIVATVCLVKVLHSRNFAIGSCFAKTEAVLTALLGAFIFGAGLSGIGWMSVCLGMLGVLVIAWRDSVRRFDCYSVCYGLLSGLAFAFTSLWLREASLSLGWEVMRNAAMTLVYMVSVQAFICLALVWCYQRVQLSLLVKHWRLCLFVGATSALGSIGWFSAMSYQNAALVKTLGQIEILMTLGITYAVFQERIAGREYIGMGLILASVLLLIWL